MKSRIIYDVFIGLIVVDVYIFFICYKLFGLSPEVALGFTALLSPLVMLVNNISDQLGDIEEKLTKKKDEQE